MEALVLPILSFLLPEKCVNKYLKEHDFFDGNEIWNNFIS